MVLNMAIGAALWLGLIYVAHGEIITLDMSYVYEENVTMYYDRTNAFSRTPQFRIGYYAAGYWLKAYNIRTPEHGGSHMDAPSHYAENGIGISEIPLSKLLSRPVIKIDISGRARSDPDTMVTVDDLEDWEKKYGRIPENAVVMMYSAWHEKYGDWQAYMGVASGREDFRPDGDNAIRHFPGFSPDATSWLCTNRSIVGLGADTASVEPGISQDFKTHTIFASHGKWALEMVANLNELPESGALVSVLPMKMKDGSGAPTRIYAIWDTNPSGASTLSMCISVMLSAFLTAWF